MPFRSTAWACVVALMLAVCLAELSAGVEIMRVDQIKPGMKGYCLTAFSGQKPEKFSIEILGVMRRFDPQSDVILFIGTDDRIRRYGILGGMSGSPAYIDGKLIGALALAWFAEKEPIGGITPIEEMFRALKASGGSEARRASGGLFRAKALNLEPYLDERGRFQLPIRLHVPLASATAGGQVVVSEKAAAQNPAFSGLLGARLSPIPLCFVSSAPRLADILSEFGVKGVLSAASKPVKADPDSLQPGSPVGVAMVTGDLDWAGIGTVTYRDGKTILAFGHPMFLAGSVRYPMCGAVVHAGLPSYLYGFKIASASEVLGEIVQDRWAAIAGKIGKKPPMLPVSVSVTDQEAQKTRRLHFGIMRDRFFLPFLTGVVGAYSVWVYQAASGEMTVDWDISVEGKRRPVVRVKDSYSDFDFSRRALVRYLAQPLIAIVENGFEEAWIESVSIDCNVKQAVDLANIISIDVDKKSVAPGERLRLCVNISPFEGGIISREYDVKVPRSCQPGTAELMVFGADSYQMWERIRAKARFVARSYDDVIRILTEAPSHRELIVVLARKASVQMVGRETFPKLPASARAVLSSAASGGIKSKATFEVIQKSVFETRYDISGKQKVQIRIKRRKV